MLTPGGECRVCILDENTRRRIKRAYLAGKGPREIASTLPPGTSERNVQYHLSHCAGVSAKDRKTTTSQLGKIADLLDSSGIDIEEISRVTEVSLKEWQGMYKDADDVAHVVDMEGAGIKLVPKWADGPAWPVVQPVPIPVIKHRPAKAKKLDPTWKRAVIFSDLQAGFRRLDDGFMDPFHDEMALDVAFQIAEDVQPDGFVNVGDGLDLSEASKFLKEEGFVRTTQPSLEVMSDVLARQRLICGPDGEIVYIEGNHEFRLKRWILENAAWAFGLKRAAMPESWPVLSLPNLLNFSELGVTYVEGYPAGIHYVNDNFAVVHGERVNSNGSTAERVIDDERVSMAFGHIHKIEDAFRTVRTPRGPKTRRATSLGCMCRTDGVVPSTKTGVRHDGRSPDRQENWQQAIGVVTYQEGDGPFSLEVIPIFDGWAVYRDKEYRSTVTPEWKMRKAA